MKIVKDEESKVVIKSQLWMRILAWIWVVAFALIFVFGLLMLILDGSSIAGYVICAFGFFFLSCGIWIVSLGTTIYFNKTQGYMVLKYGRVPILFWLKKRRMISRKEAGSVSILKVEGFNGFVPTTGFKTFMWNLRMYFFFLGPPPTFTWLGPVTQTYCQVKLLASSGEEIEIQKCYDMEMADRLAERIRDFSAQTEMPEEDVNTKKRSTYKLKPGKKKAIIAGVILILAGLIIAPFGLLAALGSPIITLIITPLGIMIIFAGVFAIIRKKWWFTVFGAVWATIIPLSFLIIYVLDVYDEYGIGHNNISVEVISVIVVGLGVIAGILSVIFISISRRIYR